MVKSNRYFRSFFGTATGFALKWLSQKGQSLLASTAKLCKSRLPLSATERPRRREFLRTLRACSLWRSRLLRNLRKNLRFSPRSLICILRRLRVAYTPNKRSSHVHDWSFFRSAKTLAVKLLSMLEAWPKSPARIAVKSAPTTTAGYSFHVQPESNP